MDDLDFYKKDKNAMFSQIQQEYEQGQYREVVKYSNIYLNYFSKIHDKMCSDVYYYNAIAHENTDVVTSRILKETSASVLGNNDENNDKTEIPKILHFIYFKEKEFQKHYYVCIKSAAVNMSDYKIIIHNDEEPVDNVWWNMTKSIDNVKINKYKRPTVFDNFQVGHVQYAADIARLEILYDYGGVYLDTDMLILKDFSSIIDNDYSIIFSTESGSHDYINSILISKPSNMFLMHILQIFKSYLRITDCWATHIREGVNTLLTRENTNKYHIQILDHRSFFNFRWLDTWKFQNIEQNITEEMFGVHLFDTIHFDILVDNEYLHKLYIEFSNA